MTFKWGTEYGNGGPPMCFNEETEIFVDEHDKYYTVEVYRGSIKLSGYDDIIFTSFEETKRWCEAMFNTGAL